MEKNELAPCPSGTFRQEKDIFESFVDGIADYVIIMLDPHGNVVTWNTGAQRITGYDKNEILNKHFSVFYSPEDINSGKPDRALQIALEEGKCKDSVWHFCKNGEKFWANVLIAPIYGANNKLSGFAKVTCDLTSQKRAEEKALKNQKALQSESFMKTLIHDLSVPLMGTRRVLEALLQGGLGDLTPEVTNTLSVIQQTNHDTLKIIHTLEDIYSYESGNYSLLFKYVQLESLIADSVAQFTPVAAIKDLSIECKLETSLRPIYADRKAIACALNNLLENAVKYTPDGGLITITARNADDSVVLQVINSGVSIPDEIKSVLFQQFWQGRPGKQYVANSGLGLYLCRLILDTHNGRIVCNTDTNTHTVFEAILPTGPAID